MVKKYKFHFLLFVFSFFFFQNNLAQQADSVYFTTDPAISPDGQTIVFCYNSDLWKVPTAGGRAVRLTGMEGQEQDPAISPDGKWLAFTSNQYGNNDIYVMPLDGGPVKQLTFHQANDQMGSWKWSSDSLYFESNRY